MKIVSLFDGIACGHVALDRARIPVEQYAAFEIDRFAKSISRYNYPHIEHCGDVLEGDFRRFQNIDMVMGGSPCTFWSIAKMNREVDKSGVGWKLFMCFMDAVRQIQPQYFIYENVASMPNTIREYISEEFGMEPVKINSALVSAQQRNRLYWTNIKGITQPEDKGILLQDILETGLSCREKTYCIDACYYKGGNHSSPNKQSGKRCMVYEPIALAEKAQTIPATIYKENALSMLMRGKTGLYCVQPIGAALRTREDEIGRFKRLEVRTDGKLNALTSVQTDSCICVPVLLGAIGESKRQSRIYSVRGKTVSISANGGGWGAKTGLYKIDLPDGDYIVRKLTPIEAERCQTLPDNYTAYGMNDNGVIVPISNTQRYKGVGNGWTVDVISHILSFIDNGQRKEGGLLEIR